MGKTRPVYCIHCGQTYVSSAAETCTLCGKSGGLADPDSPDALRDLQIKKQQDPSVGAPFTEEAIYNVIDAGLRYRRIFWCGVTGVALLALGVALLFVPGLREDPNSLSLTEILLALPPLGAGAFLLVLVFLFWKA